MAIVPDGRNAVTHYFVKETFAHPNGSCSHLQLQLETGRTHQIRVHMAHLGHPVLGDCVYGLTRHVLDTRYASLLQGQCLHARTITFRHPRTGEILHIESPLPAYFEEILTKLKETSK
jgi:23S rRNA pseudouridine1911/1915/1917 synthase